VQTFPVIGVATETLQPLPAQQAPAWIMEHRYIDTLTALGAVPWIIPLMPGNGAALEAIYARLDGVFLAGGADIDPQCYHEQRHALCGRTDAARDWTEMRLIRWALRDRKPILGVCRGLQMLNVAMGGTLFQDVQALMPGAIEHDNLKDKDNNREAREAVVHNVDVRPASQLRGILGAEEIAVNSFHHQAIKDLAESLAASAVAPDGVIEGIESKESKSHFLVGVQWHPEEMTEKHAPMRKLFESFLQAAGQFRA
jgi:putative glutamine amidotransferase